MKQGVCLLRPAGRNILVITGQNFLAKMAYLGELLTSKYATVIARGKNRKLKFALHYMTREEKASSVAELREVIDRSTGMYFTDFEGMTVEQTTRLRNELRKAGLTFKVGKNTLLRRALDDSGRLTDDLRKALVRQTGVAFGFDDPVAPARILRDFIEKNQDKPALKLAYIEGQTYPGKDLKKVAALPTKKDIMASIVGSLAAPMQGIVGVLGALQRDIVYLVDAIEKKKAETA